MEVYFTYIVLLLPLIPFLLFLLDRGKYSATLSILSGVLEFGISLLLAYTFWGNSQISYVPILNIQGEPFLQFGFWLNNYSLSLMAVVSLVSLLVRYYSSFYMKDEERKSWFIVLIGFFTFSMYGLVMSSDLLGMFFFWEWVGLASYLMIGFWYKKESAASAARKAFLYNKIGDLGFLMALGCFYYQFGGFGIPEALNAELSFGFWPGMLFGFGLLIAAMAKSAQLPLAEWLADAMEGPTPASALIHSATMVTAGIYLLIRLNVFIDPLILDVCIYLAIVTVIWAGMAALMQKDIKKILAYSTISQLGFMLLGIAVGSIEAAFFHLVTHAFFKSSLFLSAGLIIHDQKHSDKVEVSSDPQNILRIRGLFNRKPALLILTVLAAMSLSSLPFFSGFLSKEAILSGLESARFVFILALLASFLTALYSGRLIFHLLKPEEGSTSDVKILEDFTKNIYRYLPLIILVFLSLSIFYTLNPVDFAGSWFYNGLLLSFQYVEGKFYILPLSVALTLSGLGTAFVMIRRRNSDISLGVAMDRLFENAFFLDRLFYTSLGACRMGGTFVAEYVENRILNRLISGMTYVFVFIAMIFRMTDTYIVDGFVHFIAWFSSALGSFFRQFQNGSIRDYIFWLMVFLLLGLLIVF